MPSDIDLSQIQPYHPFTKEQREAIMKEWKMYKEIIGGLEGDIYLKLKMEGKNPDQITEAINKHRQDIEKDLEAWHSLRGEFLK